MTARKPSGAFEKGVAVFSTGYMGNKFQPE
jgi:hypothetical protein